jgi:hypothetical protein
MVSLVQDLPHAYVVKRKTKFYIKLYIFQHGRRKAHFLGETIAAYCFPKLFRGINCTYYFADRLLTSRKVTELHSNYRQNRDSEGNQYVLIASPRI